MDERGRCYWGNICDGWMILFVNGVGVVVVIIVDWFDIGLWFGVILKSVFDWYMNVRKGVDFYFELWKWWEGGF